MLKVSNTITVTWPAKGLAGTGTSAGGFWPLLIIQDGRDHSVAGIAGLPWPHGGPQLTRKIMKREVYEELLEPLELELVAMARWA